MSAALALLAFAQAFVLWLALRGRARAGTSLAQWSVAGGRLPGLLVFVLMAGELYTTFTFLGASGFAYGHGVAALYIVVYTCLAFVLSYWLLPAVWRMARRHGVLTQPEFFARAYDSRALGLVVALVALVALVPYLVLQLKGLGIIVELTSYGRIAPWAAVCIGAVAMGVYVTLAGMHGTARVAVVKDALVLAVCAFLGFWLPWHHYGGIGAMFGRLAQQNPGLLALPARGMGTSWFLSTVLLSALGMYLWPHAFTAIFAAGSARSFRRNAIFMPLYALVMLFAMFAGFAAVLQVPGLSGGRIDLALLELSIRSFDPWFVGVIGAAGLMTALVPSSVMVISAATLVARDLWLPLRPGSDEARLRTVSRLCVPAILAVAVLLALDGARSIVSLLIVGFSFVTQLAPALLAALAGRGASKQAALAGIAVGVGFVAWTTFSGLTLRTLAPAAPAWLQDVNIGLVGLLLNALALAAVAAFTGRSRLEAKAA